MSGPKVVRVVTREERLATCAALLRLLDQTLATWLAELRRFGGDEAAASSVRARRDQFVATLAADRFGEFVKLATAEQSFLLHDIETRRERAASAAAIARQKARQQRSTARTILQELKVKGISDATLSSSLKRVADGLTSHAEAESALGVALSRLEAPVVSGLTDAQRELAKRLALPDGDATSLRPPTATTTGPSRLNELDKRLAEFETVLGPTEASQFSSRAKAIEELQEAKQNLHIDALVIDIANALKAGKLRQQQRTAAQELLAALETTDRATGSPIALAYDDLTKAFDGDDMEALSAQMRLSQSAWDAHVRRLNSDSRRAAILSGLASLGYEVREEMATAWAKDGRVVVEKPGLPGYGVEVAADPDAARLQVRAVSLDANRDTRRDADVETLWCGDFGKLQGLLAAQGGGIDIERAHAIGAVPLKVVAVPPRASEAQRAPGQRTTLQ